MLKTGHEFCMTHLAVVALEVSDVLKGVGGEDLDEVGVGGGKHVATVAEGTLHWRRGGGGEQGSQLDRGLQTLRN